MACGKTEDGGNNKIVVQTNAYFAPFEYFDGPDIKGVDVDIMNKVANIVFKYVYKKTFAHAYKKAAAIIYDNSCNPAGSYFTSS